MKTGMKAILMDGNMKDSQDLIQKELIILLVSEQIFTVFIM